METREKKNVWIGADVSKETFFAAVDILDEDDSRKAINSLPAKEFNLTETGSDSFLKWLAESFPEYHFSIVMESTGCYSKKLSKILHAKQGDLPISILNGRLSSNFVKSLGLPHKTDKSDAQALARFGTERSPKPALPDDPDRESLKELSRERSALLKAQAALENRSDSLFDTFTQKVNDQAIAALNLQVSAIEKEMERCIKANAEMQHEAGLMKTVPGIALTSAYGFLAELGSLKQYSSRKLSSMSGLLPYTFVSGTSVNKTCLSKRGSARVRQLLYMDCMTAVNKIPELNSQYQNLVSRGKTKMTARCACMRKLLLIVRAVVVEDRSYEKIHEKKAKIA